MPALTGAQHLDAHDLPEQQRRSAARVAAASPARTAAISAPELVTRCVACATLRPVAAW